MKVLFEDAEKGILTHDDEPSVSNSNGSAPKKQKTVINQQLVTDLVNLGYPR